MFHTIKSIKNYKFYSYYVTYIHRIILCIIGSFPVIEWLRSYLIEINIFQLKPGLYLKLLINAFILLIIITSLALLVPIQDDAEVRIGARYFGRLATKLDFKITFILFQIAIYFSFSNIIPVSLEAIVQYSNTQFVEELWAYEELQEVQTVLVYAVIFVLQIPVIAIAKLYDEEGINFIPNNLKNVNFFVCIAAGMITPTIDIPTQINFILIGIFLYIYTYFMSAKHVSIETEIIT